MENQIEMKEKEKNKGKYLLIIGIYLISQFILGSIIILFLIQFFIPNTNDISKQAEYKNTLTTYLTNSAGILDAEPWVKESFSKIMGISNLISYGVSLFFILILAFNVFIVDAKKLATNAKFNAIFTAIAAVLFIGISILFDKALQNVGTSNNQSMIVAILKYGGAVPMIIAVVIMAPVIEEFIFRKSVFTLLDFAPIWVSYLISTLFFAIPHMLTTPIDGNFGLWLLKLTPYLFAGLSFSFIYHKTNNIYTCITIHMLNNLISVIMVYMGV